MKGIDKITSRIIADAETECASVKKESDERIAAIRAENEKRRRTNTGAWCVRASRTPSSEFSAWTAPPGLRRRRAS